MTEQTSTNDQPIILKGPAKMLQPLIQQVLALHQILGDKDLGAVYGVPTTILQGHYKFRPHIELFFYPHGKKFKSSDRSQVSFRLMHETTETISKAKLNQLGLRIKELFGGAEPFQWHKGKNEYTYYDQDRGYDFRVLAVSNVEAKKVITRIMEIQEHSPNWKLLFHKVPDEPGLAFPDTAQTVEILGAQVKEPVYRPNLVVSFHHAVAHIHGLKEAIHL